MKHVKSGSATRWLANLNQGCGLMHVFTSHLILFLVIKSLVMFYKVHVVYFYMPHMNSSLLSCKHGKLDHGVGYIFCNKKIIGQRLYSGTKL